MAHNLMRWIFNTRTLLLIGGLLVALPASWVGGRWALGVRHLRVVSPPVTSPNATSLVDDLNGLLEDSVRDGLVDYPMLVNQQAKLTGIVATLADSGPLTRPRQFATRKQRLAYYINAYNAFVLHAVVRHWPISSVHDVHGLIEPRQGFGFFYALQFTLDGQRLNLYDLENEVLRERFRDARIHAAINCASVSCPALAPTAYTPEHLEAQLESAMGAFCNDDRHVRIDETSRQVTLSAIFDWYRSDFQQNARLHGGATLLDSIAHYLEPARAAALLRVRRNGVTIRFADYDWRLNLAPP